MSQLCLICVITNLHRTTRIHKNNYLKCVKLNLAVALKLFSNIIRQDLNFLYKKNFYFKVKMSKHPYLLIIVAFATLLSIYELVHGYSSFRTQSLLKARDIVTVILAVEKWNSDVTDLYASSKHVEPNKYLSATDRNITYKDKELTKVNPAYMTRMASGILSSSGGITVRMISEKPLNPENTPKEWEKHALRTVSKTNKVFSNLDYTNLDNITFNYIRPVYVEKSCLECHRERGYKLNELRGGLSVSFPVTKEHNSILSETIFKISIYLVSAIFVLYVILRSRRDIINAYQIKLKTIAELEIEMIRRKKSEAALVTQTKSASANEILSLIAHHWRQPLNNIGLLIQTIKEDSENKEINESCDHAFEIVHEMSDTINMFTSSVKTTGVKNLDVKLMVFDVLKLLTPEFENSNIEVYVICNLGGTVSEPVSTDTDRVYHSCGLGNLKCENRCDFGNLCVMGEEAMFKQVLFVLIKNAYDALLMIPKDGKRAITITFDKKGSYALIRVYDNGEPITDEIKAKLFEPYFSTKGVEAGRGIGLFSAKSLVTNFEDAYLYYDDSNGKCFVFKFKTI